MTKLQIVGFEGRLGEVRSPAAVAPLIVDQEGRRCRVAGDGSIHQLSEPGWAVPDTCSHLPRPIEANGRDGVLLFDREDKARLAAGKAAGSEGVTKLRAQLGGTGEPEAIPELIVWPDGNHWAWRCSSEEAKEVLAFLRTCHERDLFVAATRGEVGRLEDLAWRLQRATQDHADIFIAAEAIERAGQPDRARRLLAAFRLDGSSFEGDRVSARQRLDAAPISAVLPPQPTGRGLLASTHTKLIREQRRETRAA